MAHMDLPRPKEFISITIIVADFAEKLCNKIEVCYHYHYLYDNIFQQDSVKRVSLQDLHSD